MCALPEVQNTDLLLELNCSTDRQLPIDTMTNLFGILCVIFDTKKSHLIICRHFERLIKDSMTLSQ